MGWRHKAATSGESARPVDRFDGGGPDLLDVWSGAMDEPVEPWSSPPHAETASPDYAQWPTPPTRSPEHLDAGAGGLTCIRLNCREQGRPTVAARCPACGHGTALLRDFRWPRTS